MADAMWQPPLKEKKEEGDFDDAFEAYHQMLADEAFDLGRTRLKPFDHQLKGIKALVENPIFALFDEMGIGKTKQVIDAAQLLFEEGKIHQVLVVAPAAVRSVWYDKNFGELKKHMWKGVPQRVVHFHQQTEYWNWDNDEVDQRYLRWVITNYEFIRRDQHTYGILDFCDTETMLVLEESSLIKSPHAKQTKACQKIRDFCGRVVLLNGTPISHSPKDMFSQGRVMDPKILDCRTYDHFLNYYSIMKVYGKHKVREWDRIEELQERFQPYVLRRLKKDCLDLPEKMDPVTMTVPLDEKTWKIYKKLKDEFIVFLEGEGSVLKAQQAIVKALRMAQLCGGFLGGLERHNDPTKPQISEGGQFVLSPEQQGLPLFMQEKEPTPDAVDSLMNSLEAEMHKPTQEIGCEKLNLLLDWIETRLNEDEKFKLLVWCRFRAENKRLVDNIKKKFPKVVVGEIHGGQSKDERQRSVYLLNPDTVSEDEAIIVVGSPQAGGMGLNLAAAHTVVYYSNDYNMKTRLQSEDRVHRPGQTHAVSYYDVVATGPKGQKTIDHTILVALREKQEVANWTTSAWLEALKDE